MGPKPKTSKLANAICGRWKTDSSFDAEEDYGSFVTSGRLNIIVIWDDRYKGAFIRKEGLERLRAHALFPLYAVAA